MTSSQLAKSVALLRVGLSANLVAKLLKSADSERKDGSVYYADFVRMLGGSANELRGITEPPGYCYFLVCDILVFPL